MSEPITPAMRRTINALLDQAADRSRRQSFGDLAKRLGMRSRGHAFANVSRLETAGFVDFSGPRMAFHWRCFKVFKVVSGERGAALERWG